MSAGATTTAGLSVADAYAAIQAHLDEIQELRSYIARRQMEEEPQIVRKDGLSEAERRVARLLRSHLSAPEIGRELYLSTNTVKTHMKRIYRKLGVVSRSEAVAALARNAPP